MRKYKFKNKGYCVCCDKKVLFVAKNDWLRDFYICSNCKSIPRERALMFVIEKYYPHWKKLKIHESSPIERGASLKLKKECKQYIASQYWPEKKQGVIIDGFINVNLEKQPFKDESFDLVITQDVMEHVFNPIKAFKEIARTLKVGGAHIFTVPLVNKNKKSEIWAKKTINGKIKFQKEPEYHGNPINKMGSPVTMHWGYDIVDVIYKNSGLITTICFIEDLNLGIKAEYIEVLVSKKISQNNFNLLKIIGFSSF